MARLARIKHIAGVTWLAAPWENAAAGGLNLGGVLAILAGGVFWAFGAIYGRRVREPAEPFTATGRSRDGIVEVMELRPELAGTLPFFLSVQFHPERLTHKHGEHRALFKQFARASAQHGK